MKIKGKNIPLQDMPRRVVTHLLYQFRERIEDLRAFYYLNKISEKKNELKRQIKVAFIVQMPEVWDKEEPVYKAMKEDHRFDTTMIVVPSFNQITNRVEEYYENNFFLTNYPDSICAYRDGEWIFHCEEYDYVFYQRPYDYYLPTQMQSRKVVPKTKCCYIPYGYTGSDAFNKSSTDQGFFRNLYLGFAESKHMAKVFEESYHTKRKRMYHHIYFLGYPALIPYFDLKPTFRYRRFLWTPRWSYAPLIGGSHFIEYKDFFLHLKDSMPTIELTFRPHQLLFNELRSKSLMTNFGIETFLEQLKEKDIKFDTGSPIYDTLKNTDVLITDYSSIVIQFFITGRPIIYCDSDVVLNEDYKKLSEGMYVVHNENELLEMVKNLYDGIDPLQEKRQEIIQKYLNVHRDSTNKILETIVSDYQGKL